MHPTGPPGRRGPARAVGGRRILSQPVSPYLDSILARGRVRPPEDLLARVVEENPQSPLNAQACPATIQLLHHRRPYLPRERCAHDPADRLVLPQCRPIRRSHQINAPNHHDRNLARDPLVRRLAGKQRTIASLTASLLIVQHERNLKKNRNSGEKATEYRILSAPSLIVALLVAVQKRMSNHINDMSARTET